MKRKPVIEPDNGFADHGGYMSAKVTKLEDQFNFIQSACKQKSKIFEGISIFVNGHTNPSADELKRIMLENSGTFHHYQRSHTNFIIASNLPDVKIRSNITKNIVKPEWISDSLRENRLLDYSKYLLHTNKSRAQPQISFKPEVKAEPATEVDSIDLDLKILNEKLFKIAPKPEAEDSKNENKSKPDRRISTDESRTGTAVDPNFLHDFLNNSRLHHISTLGSGFKFHINDLRKNHDGKFPEREVLKTKLKRSEISSNGSETVVMHIDMDCFFVSVSLKNHPHLKGVPVAVTHSKGKNEAKGEDFTSYAEIASCSYEARAKGLKNGMFVGAALKLCPELKTIPYDFEAYKNTAFTLYDTIAKYTLDIEAVSCDELYADLKSLLVECHMDVNDFVTILRQEIFDQTGCTCSVGLGANRLQARMATKEAKPNGQFSLLGADIEKYMSDKKIRDLPGVGPNTSHQLAQLKLETCGQLQNLPVQILQQNFGKKFGESLKMMAQGIDDKKLVFEQVRKSVSVEVNYGIRFNEDHEVHTFLKQVADELSKRLREINKKGKLLTLKLMTRSKDASVETLKFMGHGQIDKISKSVALLASTDDSIMIHNSIVKLLVALNFPPHELRGIGVQMSKLDEDKKDSKLIQMFKKAAEKQQTDGQRSSPSKRAKLEPLRFERKPSANELPKNSPAKKRGRPKKFATSASNQSLVSNLFATKKFTKTSFKRHVEMIDPEVLAELPPEIVEEILREYQLPDETSSDAIELNISDESSRGTSVADQPQESSADNVFLRVDWRTAIRDWIDEVEGNSEWLAEKIKHDACQLVRLKEIDTLYVALRFLHRIFDALDLQVWKEMYNAIVAGIQDEMLKKYSRKLSVPVNL